MQARTTVSGLHPTGVPRPRLFVALAVLGIGCGANGHLVEDEFQAWTDDETEAKNRIRH